MVLFLLVLPAWFWLGGSRLGGLWSVIWGGLRGEFRILLGRSSGLGVLVVIMGLFTLIVVRNVMGLVPYVFTGTAHFSVTVRLALPL